MNLYTGGMRRTDEGNFLFYCRTPFLALLRNLGAFAIGLAGICGAIHGCLPFRDDVPIVSAKLRWLEKYGDQYDTLFVGSSRVFHQVVPSIFDARFAELGQSARSYNLGADGMNFPEAFHAADHAAKLLPRLRLVVVELGNLQTGLEDKSVRSLYWHSPQLTWMTLRSIAGSDGGYLEKSENISGHLALFARNFGNLGRGQQWLRILPDDTTLAPIGDHGCVVVDRSMDNTQSREFTNLLTKRGSGHSAPVLRDPALSEGFNDFSARMNSRGIRVIFVKMPTFRRYSPPSPEQMLLDFDIPGTFPELWDARDRYDAHHLNADGARNFTRMLAGKIAASAEQVTR